ncbi:MAG: PAS domain S-box protein [Gammaproteobacteria bacterium]|nr:PAS domain S-box protein [Gammaproteobacteria bacterium]
MASALFPSPSPAARENGIVAGVVRGFAPYYVTVDDKVTGFAVDFMDELARRAGLDVTYRVFDAWDEAFEAVRSGDVDLLPNVGISEARRDLGHFSMPYESVRVLLFAREETPPVTTLDELALYLVGVVSTNVASTKVAAHTRQPPREFESYVAALEALHRHQVDLIVGPETVIEHLVRTRFARSGIRHTGPPLVHVDRGLLVTPERGDLLARLDDVLEEFVNSTEFESIYLRWHDPAPTPVVSRWQWVTAAILLVILGIALVLTWRLHRTLHTTITGPDQVKAERQIWYRLLVATGLLTILGLGVLSLMTLLFYRVAFEQERMNLLDQAEATRQLIETVARFDRRHSAYPEGPEAGTLLQIREGLIGLPQRSEAIIGVRDGDRIRLLLRQKAARVDAPRSIPMQSPLGEPIRRAVSGQTGWMIGRDYRGIEVLAGYTELPLLGAGYGLVIKENLETLRAPYLHALWTGSLLILGFSLLAASGYFALTLPIIRAYVHHVERFELAMRGTSDGLWDWDLVKNRVYQSPRWRKMLGYGKDEIGEDPEESLCLIHPEDRERVEALIEDYLAGRTPEFNTEFRMRHKDGHWVDIISRAYGIWNTHGECTRLVGTHIDVSMHRRAEEKLRELARFVEDNPNPVLRIDRNGDVTVANPAAQALINEVSDRQPTAPTPRDLHAWRELLQFARRVERPEQYDIESGDHIYMVDIVPEADGHFINLYATDIRARRKAESRLRKLYQAVEQSFSMIIITDNSGTIEYVNPEVSEITGYARSEVIGRKPNLWKSDETPEATFRELWTTITSGETWSGEFRNRRKDGSLFTASATISPIRGEGNRIEGFIAVEVDISERLAIEEQLRQSQKLETLGQLTGGIAHDFNNLLTIIMGNLQLLERAVKADSKLADLAASAIQATHRGATLTRRLLGFSRRQVLQNQAVDLNETVRGVAEMLRRTIPENIRISFQLDDRPIPVWLDPLRLEDVLLNLVVNARDAMPDGGELVIETAFVDLDAHYAASRPDVTPGRYAQLTISDTGVGMPPETAAHAFEPFFTTKEVGKGTGLGLSMVYGFAKQSGGHVDLYSEQDVGTSIKLYFPLHDDAVEETASGDAPHAAVTSGDELILVVEDDAGVRKTVTNMLYNLGYRVLEASEGGEALKQIEAHPEVDLVLTDVVMPGGMDGPELAERIEEQFPWIKVLFTSGFAEKVLHGRGQRLRQQEWLPKPYTEDQLARCLRKLLDTDPA